MFALPCPLCAASTNLSFIDPVYRGPFRCWKCRGVFLIVVENEELKSLSPISGEEFERHTG